VNERVVLCEATQGLTVLARDESASFKRFQVDRQNACTAEHLPRVNTVQKCDHRQYKAAMYVALEAK